MSRVAVIGGGIVGSSTAWHLAKAGVETVLIDRFDNGQATSAGAGIISPGGAAEIAESHLRLAAKAVAYYPDLIAALEEQGQTGTGYAVVGELIAARNAEEWDVIQSLLPRYQTRAGFDSEAITLIDGVHARSMFPALGDFVPGAIHIPGVARIDGAFTRDALQAAALSMGVQQIRGAATFELHGERVAGVRAHDQLIEAEAYVIAGGAWTNALLDPFGVRIGVNPQRGQILHIRLEGSDTSTWPVIQKLSDQYILTFGPDRVVVGATREFDSGFDYRLTAGGTQSVLNEAISVAPGLARGTIGEWRIGFRPFSEDGLPYIGALPGFDNVIVAAGHGPSGLTLGPYSGLVASQLATNVAPDLDLSAYRVER